MRVESLEGSLASAALGEGRCKEEDIEGGGESVAHMSRTLSAAKIHKCSRWQGCILVDL